ncbi:MAG: CoA ester lyase [Acholeplasmataceae bacterium]|nr:CoA ester lyase [Acholeplasmataceae bacterium]
MRRSLLFIPSNSPAMLQNADIFGADGVIFDLEDAVSIHEKDAARTLLDTFLSMYPLNHLEIIVRINQIESSIQSKELELIISDKIDTIMLPKATVSSTMILIGQLKKIEIEKKLTKKIQIIPIIEMAESVLEVKDIAKLERVNGLLLGAEDLASDLEVSRSIDSLEILMPRAFTILAAKANKIDAIDTPFIHKDDEDGLMKDAKFAKQLGMNAKACIHPNQVEIINDIFSPSKDEIKQAQRIIEAYHKPENMHKGAFSLDGKMVDKPIIDRALKLIDKAKAWHLL